MYKSRTAPRRSVSVVTRRIWQWCFLLIRVATVSFRRHFAMRALPYKLTVEVTRLCNGHCDPNMCAMWMARKDPTELATDEIVRSVTSLGRHLCWLNITGGEPSLRRDLPEIVKGCVGGCPNLFLINMPVNGRRPDDTASLIKILVTENPEILFQITVSIDGLDDLQDTIRGPGQNKLTQQTWGLLNEIARRHSNLRISAQSTISKLNLHQARELQRHYAPKSENYIVAIAAELGHYLNDASGIALMPDQPGVIETITDLASSYPARLSKPVTCMQKIALLGHVRRMLRGSTGIPCAAASATITLKANGTLAPCLFKGEDDIANVHDHEYDLPAMLRLAEADSTRQAVAACQKCWINCESIPSLMTFPIHTAALLCQRPSRIAK